jgi:hypothetical protein
MLITEAAIAERPEGENQAAGAGMHGGMNATGR